MYKSILPSFKVSMKITSAKIHDIIMIIYLKNIYLFLLRSPEKLHKKSSHHKMLVNTGAMHYNLLGSFKNIRSTLKKFPSKS